MQASHIQPYTYEKEDLPYILVKHLNRFSTYQKEERKFFYSVSDISRCLRQSYYKITETKQDDISGAIPLEELWSIESGNYLHQLTYASKWRELDIERKFLSRDIDETLYICGRLDLYDYKTERIIDVKKTNAVTWQRDNGFIPRQEHVLEIQCYGTLFSNIIPVANLTLVYVDLKTLIPFKIPLVNNFEWIRERVSQLHICSQITKNPPAAERSEACNYCKFKRTCDSEDDMTDPR
jgi:hypothetical protein